MEVIDHHPYSKVSIHYFHWVIWSVE